MFQGFHLLKYFKVWTVPLLIALLTSTYEVEAGDLSASISVIAEPGCNDALGQLCVTVTDSAAGPVRFDWQHLGLASRCLDSLGAGNYKVRVSDGVSSLVLKASLGEAGNFQVVLDTIINASCGLNNAQIFLHGDQGNGPPYSYQWYQNGLIIPGAINASLSNLDIGTYSVEVNDGICATEREFKVARVVAPEISFVSSTLGTCENGGGTLEVSSTGGVGVHRYSLFQYPDLQDPILISGIPQFSGLGDACYAVVVTDKNCTDSLLNICLGGTSRLEVTIADTTWSRCGKNNGSATVGVTNGSGNFSFKWYETPLPSSFVASGPFVNNLWPRCYAVIAEDLDFGCFDTAYTCIGEGIPGINIEIEELSKDVCFQGTGSARAIVYGGVGGYSYTWFTSSNDSIGEDTLIENLTSGSYYLLVSDGKCSNIKFFSISAISDLEMNLVSLEKPSCDQANGAVVLTVNGGAGANYEFTWPSGVDFEVSGDSTLAYTLSPGNYCVEVLSGSCFDSVCFTLTEVPQLNLSFDVVPDTCNAGIGLVSANIIGGKAPFQWSWSNGAINSQIDALSPGTYSLSVTDSNQCVVSDSTTVYSIRNQMTSNSYLEGPLGDCNIFDTTLITAYLEESWMPNEWFGGNDSMKDFGDQAILHCDSLGYYNVCLQAMDNYSCLDTACISIRVVQQVYVHIANAFSPNNDDGKNEFWAPAMSGIAKMHGHVFSLWGEEVFRFESKNDYWDGRTKQGKRAQSDSYVYRFVMTDFQGEVHTYTGMLILVN